MASLCAIRSSFRVLTKPQAVQFMYSKSLAIGPSDRCSRLNTTHQHALCTPHMLSKHPLVISASLRSVHTSASSALRARFQRPRALTPDDVDWSKMESLNSPYKHSFDPHLVGRLLDNMDKDMPVSDPEMPDPFEKNYRRCFLCRNDVHLDHKNVRLLSQFVSPHTGRIYGRAITGLCIPMQRRVASLIKRARVSGFMPYMFKDSKYLNDPQPYDVMTKKF